VYYKYILSCSSKRICIIDFVINRIYLKTFTTVHDKQIYDFEVEQITNIKFMCAIHFVEMLLKSLTLLFHQ